MCLWSFCPAKGLLPEIAGPPLWNTFAERLCRLPSVRPVFITDGLCGTGRNGVATGGRTGFMHYGSAGLTHGPGRAAGT